MGKRKQSEITLTEDQAFVVGELEAVKATLDELVGVAVGAVEAEIGGAVKVHDELYGVATDSVASVLGDAGETLSELTRLVEVSESLAAEGEPELGSLEEIFPEIASGQYTPKQMLWLQLRSYYACVQNNRLNRVPNVDSICQVYLDRARILESYFSLPPKQIQIPYPAVRISSINVPQDADIQIVAPNGRVW